MASRDRGKRRRPRSAGEARGAGGASAPVRGPDGRFLPAAAAEPDELPTIDLARREDRQLLRQAVSAGWGLSPAQLQRAVKLLEDAEGIARVRSDERAMRGCVDLWLRIAGQVQADQHLEAKLAAGQGPTGEVTIRVVRED